MSVGRGAATEDLQFLLAGIAYLVCRSGRNSNGIADDDRKCLIAQCHLSLALDDVIQLFSGVMTVEHGFTADSDNGLGEALIFIAMLLRVQ